MCVYQVPDAVPSPLVTAALSAQVHAAPFTTDTHPSRKGMMHACMNLGVRVAGKGDKRRNLRAGLPRVTTMEGGKPVGAGLARLPGRLTAELVLRSPQFMSCLGLYEIDLRGGQQRGGGSADLARGLAQRPTTGAASRKDMRCIRVLLTARACRDHRQQDCSDRELGSHRGAAWGVAAGHWVKAGSFEPSGGIHAPWAATEPVLIVLPRRTSLTA